MKVGTLSELMAFKWMTRLQKMLDEMIAGIEWLDLSGAGACTARSEGFGSNPPGSTHPMLMEEDACYPYKRMVQASLRLPADIDVLFIPRMVELDGFLMCPNFRALPDMVRLNMKHMGMDPVPLITPVMAVKKERDIKTLAKSVGRQLSAYSGSKFSRTMKKRQKKAGSRPLYREPDRHGDDLSKAIALIGHPYMTTDPILNNGIVDILHGYGYRTLGATDIPFKTLNRLAGSRDYYAKKLYWCSAREILGAFIYYRQIRHPAGIIQLVPFNCGVDALLRIELMSLHKKFEKGPPFMVIVCDQHTQRDHVITRIEAFLDIIKGVRID